MIKPTAQEVKEYADSIGFDLDAEYFIAKNDTVGWMVGGRNNFKPMASWKGCVQTWFIAAKRRQKATQATVGERVKRFIFEPTVFVQCVKGPTVGRFIPIVLRESHQRELPNERYIAAAEAMCMELSKPDGVEWVIREEIDERTMMKERAAATPSRPQEKRKKNPFSINKVVHEQIKEIKKNNTYTKKLEDDLKF